MFSHVKIKRGINFLSPFYDIVSVILFGNALRRCENFFISRLKKSGHILIFGGGTGKILVELMKNDAAEKYTYVDISEKMIRKTKNRIQKNFPVQMNKVNFICGSYSDIGSEEKVDLLITPYVLDFFSDEELPELMSALNKTLSPAGKWLFTDFNVPERPSMKFISKFTIKCLYFLFKIFCGLKVKRLPDFEKHFSDLKFKVENEKYFAGGMLVTRIYIQN